jgi:phosphatidylglycerol:prolipoprotein diacylglycerol transferase
VLPVLFHVGTWPMPTHPFFIGLGILAAIVVFTLEARRRSMLDERLVVVVISALLLGGIFARLSTVWQYLDHGGRLADAWADSGKSILGGLTGAYLGAIVGKWIVRYRGRTGDLFAPAVALAMAIGRVGCLLTEQPGSATSLPWGVHVAPSAAIPHCAPCLAGQAMHPSFAYEIAFHLVAFGVLLWLRPRVHVQGHLFTLYLLWYAVFRFGVEFTRGNEVVLAGLSRSQLFLIPSMVLLAVAVVRASPRRLVPRRQVGLA